MASPPNYGIPAPSVEMAAYVEAIVAAALAGGGGGGITSLTLAMPSIFTVSGSPATPPTGAFSVIFAGGQTQNRVLASPDGSSGALALRALTANDLPAGIGGGLPGFVADSPAAGPINNYAPTGFGSTTHRLYVTPASGGTTLNGLLAGFDGQMVLIVNASSTDSLVLNNQNAGSLAANQFFTTGGNLTLPPRGRTLAVYTAQSINLWSIG